MSKNLRDYKVGSEIDLPDGTYQAILAKIEVVDKPEKWTLTNNPYAFRFIFFVYQDEDNLGEDEGYAELMALKGASLSPRSHAYRWLRAARGGGDIAKGTPLSQVAGELPLICQVEIVNNVDSGFCAIENVVPASKKRQRTKISASLLADLVEGDEDDDDDDDEDIPY